MKARSWLVMSTGPCQSSIVRARCSRPSASRWFVGSSRTSASGRSTRMRARRRRARCPGERDARGRERSRPPRARASRVCSRRVSMVHASRAIIAARTRSYSASSRGEGPWARRSVRKSKRAASPRVPDVAVSMRCATVRASRASAGGGSGVDLVSAGGGGTDDGGTSAGGDAWRDAEAGGALTVPESGSSCPAARASSVDLPIPFGPTTTSRSAGPHVKETLSRTGVAP